LFLLGSSNYQEGFSAVFPNCFLPLIVVGGISFTAVYLMGKIINKKDVSTSQSRLTLTKLFVVLILGGIVGIVFFFVWPYLPIGNWSRYEQLPSKALRFMGHDDEGDFFGGVYVEAADGMIYHCQDVDSPCVASREFSPEVYPDICQTYDAPTGVTPWTPGKVIDKLSYHFCGIDTSEDRYYIILENGSVWNWDSPGFSGNTARFFLGFWTLIGAIAGALVWLFSKVFPKR
jgi:hypothetical protein